jgi:autotransporter-associated beta strand protein
MLRFTMLRTLCGFLIAATLLVPAGSVAQVQVNQTFVPQGPSPKQGPVDLAYSTDQPGGQGTVTGAVQAILVDPALGPNTMFIGATNGGIWSTTDAGASWTPLTDKQASLSIASLALDAMDTSGRTLIAGIGITSNGLWSNESPDGRGGLRTGLLYSTDAGNTWSALGGAALADQSVIGVAARGNIIMAATFEAQAASVTQVGTTGSLYGLYRSVDGGQTFSRVTSGLPSGPVTALVADPSNQNIFYASVTSPSNPAAAGVFVSTNSGATWSPVFTSATAVSGGTNVINGAMDQLVPKIATGPNGSVAIAIANARTGQINGLYLSQNAGASWSNLAFPQVNPGGQALVNLVIAIDPKNTSIVYIAGDAESAPGGNAFALPAYRVQGNSFTTLNITGFAHPDVRSLVFDASGNLLIGSDGGIYRRMSPATDNGAWQGFNTSTLQIQEPYAVAYGFNARRFISAAQDTGTSVQSAPNNVRYDSMSGADGINAVASDKTFPDASVYYMSVQELGGLQRLVVDRNGVFHQASVTCEGAECGCSPPTGQTTCSTAVLNVHFNSPFVLNRENPTRIAIAGSAVYVSTDTAAADATTVDLTLTNLGDTASTVSRIAYGTHDNVDVLLAGASTGSIGTLWLSTTSAGNSLNRLDAYELAGGGVPTSLVFDQRSSQRFYVADGTSLWGTQDQGQTINPLTANLPANVSRPTSVEFINNNGVNALLTGGLTTVANAQSQIAVADSDDSGNLLNWRLFGDGLPNVLVSQMSYNSLGDVLAVSTVGRGVFALYDVTSYFKQASVLQFGLADNDSRPDALFLTDGTSLDGTSFSRPLNKYGTGLLTIAGIATYTGATAVIGGTLEVDGSIASSSGVAVDAGAALAGTGTVGATTIMTGGVLAPGNAANPTGTLTVAGNLTFQSGAFYLVQVNSAASSGTNVSGTASLAGTVNAVFAPGSSVARQYLILQSAGLNGTMFSGLTSTNLPLNFIDSLSYTANDVFLNLTAALGTGTTLNVNQRNVANAVNNFFNSGGPLPPAFGSLFGLTGANLHNALGQNSGEAATGAQKVAFQFTDQFLNLMLDPFVDGRSGIGGTDHPPLGFAPEDETRPSAPALAFASVFKAPPAVPRVYSHTGQCGAVPTAAATTPAAIPS